MGLEGAISTMAASPFLIVLGKASNSFPERRSHLRVVREKMGMLSKRGKFLFSREEATEGVPVRRMDGNQ